MENKLDRILSEIDRCFTSFNCWDLVSKIDKPDLFEVQLNSSRGDFCTYAKIDQVAGDLLFEVAELSPIYKLRGQRYYKVTPRQADKIKAKITKHAEECTK